MENFQVVAGRMITEMEKHARKLGVKGVIVVASMDDSRILVGISNEGCGDNEGYS